MARWAVFSCSYNGWADAPEDEREALDAYECGVAEVDATSAREQTLIPQNTSSIVCRLRQYLTRLLDTLG